MNLPEAGKFHDIKRHDPPTVGFRLFILEKDLAVFDLPRSTLHSPALLEMTGGKVTSIEVLSMHIRAREMHKKLCMVHIFLCIKPFFADLA